MSENKQAKQKNPSADWLIQGVLTKLGDIFDRFTGRDWQPSSSLATSELIERLKKLLDSEAIKTDDRGEFVPHNIKLKMQWDKFSTDAEEAIEKLENELLIAAVDHINDRRYHTYAPIKLEIKPDYFTEGVKLQAGFEKFADEAGEGEIRVAIPDLEIEESIVADKADSSEESKQKFVAEFTEKGNLRRKTLFFAVGERLSVGRTPENDLMINDPSVSKAHAALVLNDENQLLVADTGSTNGTFINNKRISYGKARLLKENDKLKFGTVEVSLNYGLENSESEQNAVEEMAAKTEGLPVQNDFDKTRKVIISDK